jgi:hypothetical protein
LRCCDVSRTAAAALQLSPAESYYHTQITSQPTPTAEIAHSAVFVRSHSERGPPLA